MANSLVNALQAKRRFVESLTHQSNYGDEASFLSPTIQQPITKSKIPVETPKPVEASKPVETPKPAEASQTSVKVKKASQPLRGEIQLTESEYQRIINLLESRQNKTGKPKQIRKQEDVPVWAKLAYASSNPNSRSQYY